MMITAHHWGGANFVCAAKVAEVKTERALHKNVSIKMCFGLMLRMLHKSTRVKWHRMSRTPAITSEPQRRHVVMAQGLRSNWKLRRFGRHQGAAVIMAGIVVTRTPARRRMCASCFLVMLLAQSTHTGSTCQQA